MPTLPEAPRQDLSSQEVIDQTAAGLGVPAQDVQQVLTAKRLSTDIKWDTPKIHSPKMAILTGVGPMSGSYTVEIRTSEIRILDKKAFQEAGSPVNRVGEFMQEIGKSVEAVLIDMRAQTGRASRDTGRALMRSEGQRSGRADDNTPFEG